MEGLDEEDVVRGDGNRDVGHPAGRLDLLPLHHAHVAGPPALVLPLHNMDGLVDSELNEKKV